MKRGSPVLRRWATALTVLATTPAVLALVANLALRQAGCVLSLASVTPPCGLPGALADGLGSLLVLTIVLSPFLIVPGAIALFLWTAWFASRRLDPPDGLL